MKKTYHLPSTETIQYVAMERIMDATIISGDNVPIGGPGEDEALMQ